MKKSALNLPHNNRSLIKRVGIDILGGLLILAAILFGWLPGVGGIPLFLAGLGLLATNHKWARDLLEAVKSRGTRIIKIIFRDHPLLVMLYDVASIAFLILAAIIIGNVQGNLGRGFAGVIAFVGTGLFLGNRNRIERINNFTRKLRRRKR